MKIIYLTCSTRQEDILGHIRRRLFSLLLLCLWFRHDVIGLLLLLLLFERMQRKSNHNTSQVPGIIPIAKSDDCRCYLLHRIASWSPIDAHPQSSRARISFNGSRAGHIAAPQRSFWHSNVHRYVSRTDEPRVRLKRTSSSTGARVQALILCLIATAAWLGRG